MAFFSDLTDLAPPPTPRCSMSATSAISFWISFMSFSSCIALLWITISVFDHLPGLVHSLLSPLYSLSSSPIFLRPFFLFFSFSPSPALPWFSISSLSRIPSSLPFLSRCSSFFCLLFWNCRASSGSAASAKPEERSGGGGEGRGGEGERGEGERGRGGEGERGRVLHTYGAVLSCHSHQDQRTYSSH